MGNAPCSNVCTAKIEQFDFPNTESIPQLDKKSFAIRIQSNYRRYSSRKRLRSLLIEKLEKKRRIISSSITFKESWELYFKSSSEFDFSYEGLELLKKKIGDFYLKFFAMKEGNQQTIALSQLIKTKKGEEFNEDFKKWIFIFMKKDFYLGSLEENIFVDDVVIEAIENSDESAVLKRTFTINEEENKEETMIKFELSIEPKKDNPPLKAANPLRILSKFNQNGKLMRSSKVKLTNQPLIGNQKKIFQILTKKAIEKQKHHKEKVLLFEPKDGRIMMNNILNIINEHQNKKCTSISFKDSLSHISYSGSFNSTTQHKEGLGSEYMIDPLGGGIYKYCGTYLSNAFHGVGMLIKENGEMFFGEFREGAKNGFGYHYSDNSFYSGFFKNDKYHGYGELHIKDKLSYYGTWRNGCQEGIGFYQSNSLNTYCGKFSNGRINGKGYFRWSEGQAYLGAWKDDQMDGYGEFVYKNGDVYRGYYKNDLKHGSGVYSFRNGMELKGKWMKGSKDGDFYLNMAGNPVVLLIKYEDDIQLNR